MIEHEITQAKQCALTTRDWDTYQVIIRTCLTHPPSFIEKAAQNETVKQRFEPIQTISKTLS